MSGQIYQTLLEDLDKGEEVALITKYNLETKEICLLYTSPSPRD